MIHALDVSDGLVLLLQQEYGKNRQQGAPTHRRVQVTAMTTDGGMGETVRARDTLLGVSA